MSLWRSLKAGTGALFHKEDAERELDDELRHYLAMATQENVRRGMSPADAERAARVQLGAGSFESTKQVVRSGGWEAVVESFLQDASIALRGLRRSPGFTLIATLSLALGIGVTTTMFSVLNAVMFRPLPWYDSDRLALIFTDDPKRGLHREPTAYATITDWKTRTRAFQDVAYFSTGRVTPIRDDPSRGRGRTRGATVSGNFFAIVGATPYMGRLISQVEEQERAPVAVISYSFWQKWFDGAPDVIGRTVTLDDGAKEGPGPRTVIGVLAPEFYFPDRTPAWQTEIFTPSTRYWRFDRESSERFPPWARRWTAIGRLRPDASMDDARADMNRVGRELASVFPTEFPDFPGFGTFVLPMHEAVAGTGVRAALWMLLGAVGVVLLVVCANVANLLLARGATRQRELAIRSAIGAGRGRIARQLLAESMVLVFLGGACGVFVAALGTPALAAVASAYAPRMDEVALDWRVLAFAVATTITAGIVFGLVPALRLSSANANEALREGGQGTGTVALRGSQGALVLAECALALVLLMGAGLLLKSLGRLNSVEPGFDPSRVLTMRLEFAPDAFVPPVPSTDAGAAVARVREQFMTDLLARVRVIPGVEEVGFIDDLWVAGQGNQSITILGRPADEIPAGELNSGGVSPGFFEAMRVPLKRGRYPTRDDAARAIHALWSLPPRTMPLAVQERLAAAEPVVVNESFVRRFFPDVDPIGKRFCVDPTNKTYWFEIVGVVGDMHRSGLERAAIPEFFGPHFPSRNGRSDLVVRTSGDPLAQVGTIRGVVQGLMPSILVVSVATAEQGLGGFLAQRRAQTWLLVLFASLALVLAAIGIFGLAHYAVSERTREIGVRVALGATPGEILRLIIAQGMRMPAIGIGVGLVAALALTRVIASQLYDVQPTDPATYVAVAAVLALVSAAACYLAARRAARVDPVEALRQE